MRIALLCHSDRDLPEPAGLAKRVASGERAALELLVQLYQPRITRLAHRLMGWSGEVEDVVQDVFLAAVKSGGRFRRDSSIWTWLSAITINCVRSRQRRDAVIGRVLRSIGVRSNDVESADTPAVQDESARQVRAAVSVLAPKDREVVVLFYLEQRTIAQMTAILGGTPNAIQVRLHRARARLRARLAAYVQE